jgi:hypothetical protein
MFELIKQWFSFFQSYHEREEIILNVRKSLVELSRIYKQRNSERGGEETKEQPITQTIQPQIEILKNTVISDLGLISKSSQDLYSQIKDSIKSFSKLLNFTLKFLNFPEYYFKSNRVFSVSPPNRATIEPK